MSTRSNACAVRGLHRIGIQVRLPKFLRPAGSFVSVRWSLQVRADVPLQGLPREGAPVGEPVMHADTGLLAAVGIYT
jgi:hypothetical protein